MQTITIQISVDEALTVLSVCLPGEQPVRIGLLSDVDLTEFVRILAERIHDGNTYHIAQFEPSNERVKLVYRVLTGLIEAFNEAVSS